MTTRSWRYRFGSALPLGVLACLCSLCATEASAANWSLAQVDNSADVGKYASMAVDGNKKLHVSYFDTTGKLKYATNQGGSWTPTTIVSSGVVSAGTAIDVEPGSNHPQISYYFNASASNRGARYATFDGTTWATQQLNGSYAPSTEQGTSVYHKDGVSYLAFVKNAGSLASLVYTRNNTPYNYSAWAGTVTLDNDNVAGTYNSIVVDSAGYIHAVGYNSTTTDLFYMTNSSGAWNKGTLATSADIVGKYCTLAIDAGNNLHLAYLETTSAPATYRIKYRYKPAGGAWQDPVDVADAGTYGGHTSIAVDANGTPYISYYYAASATTGKLRYASNLSGAWSSEDVDATSANVGQYTSIAVASDETVSIAYYDVTNSALKVATLNPMTASVPFGTVDRGFQSVPMTITVTNTESAAVTIGTVTKSGLNAEEFVIENDGCSGLQLAPQVSCDIVAHFAPPAAAPRSTARNATLSIPRSAPYSALAYALTGSTSANFLVTASASNGGSISPTKVAVAPNANQSFSVTAESGFSVASVTADGTTQLVAPYTLSNVNADHTVLASFASPIRVLESSIFYGSLQAAFGVLNPGWTIQTQNVIPAGDLLVDRDVAVTLSGGYDSAFASQTGLTSLPGSIVVSNGTLAVENIVIQ